MPLSRCLVIFEKELCTFSKKIAIAVTEVVLIQLFSLAVVSTKNKNENKLGPSCHSNVSPTENKRVPFFSFLAHGI